jgi:small-conductance mechanosensitive channel
VYPADAATLARVKRFVAEMNPTVRGLLLIALVSAAIVALQGESALVQVSALLQILFVIALAIFLYTAWRQRRHEIELWPARARITFYAAAALILADIAAFWYDQPSGPAALAFFLVLGICGFAMFRVWRDQHTYS